MGTEVVTCKNRRPGSAVARQTGDVGIRPALVAHVAPRSQLALLAPQQGIAYSYEELDLKVRKLACGLEDLGWGAGMVCVSDAPNVAENLILQLALSSLGAAIATPPKDATALEALCSKHNVRGVVCLESSSTTLPDSVGAALSQPLLPTVVIGDAENDAVARPPRGVASFEELIEHCPPRGQPPATEAPRLLGVYGGADLTHSAAVELGVAAAAKLGIGQADRVCCSVTLMHAFGIGSAVTSALVSGAAVVLPAVGGIRGCGNATQRASVTLDVLAGSHATVLFADTHTLRAMPTPPASVQLALRTGVCKIASGSSFLDGVTQAPAAKGGEPLPLEYAGVAFHAMGKA